MKKNSEHEKFAAEKMKEQEKLEAEKKIAIQRLQDEISKLTEATDGSDVLNSKIFAPWLSF